MGIFCEINLFKPPNGTYQPGQSVRGIIKYVIDEPIEFDKITISLKGSGYIRVTKKRRKNNTTYSNSEVYVDVDNVIQEEKQMISTGTYEIKFSFNLPKHIPSSTNIHRSSIDYTFNCKIKYYIRIKFERAGFFNFNKHFKKEISIISGILPTLPRAPIIYGESKKPMQLFSNTKGAINIKATITNSVIPCTGKIEIHYELENHSRIQVKSVEIKLIEAYKYLSRDGHRINLPEACVPDTDSKTLAIQCGHTQNMKIEIIIPSDIHSLENSKIVSRDYLVRLEAALPVPHRNILLSIPVQIGRIDENSGESSLNCNNEEIAFEDPPPSYWEAMGETKKDHDNVSDDENTK